MKDPILIPRVFDENGNPVAWWGEKFHEKLIKHPKIIELYEKEAEK